MSRTLVLNKYRCQHVEPFRLRQEDLRLFKEYLGYDEDSGKKCLEVNSIECHGCLSSFKVTNEKPPRLLDEYSSQSMLPPQPNLYEWYTDLLYECRDVPFKEGSRLLELWARDIVYLYQPPEIKRFFRRACGAHDMAGKAELSAAITKALSTKAIEQRSRFWGELSSAFQIPNLRRPVCQASGAESECFKIIQALARQFEEETKLLRLLTCDYPVGTTTPPRIVEARKEMGKQEPVIAEALSALKKVIDSLQTFSLDTNDLSQHVEVSNAVTTGRWLTVGLYQLYAKQKSIMWQLAMQK